MKFKFLTKSTEWLGSSPHRTIVVVGNEEGATIPYAFDKEAINLTDSELFDMAMDKIYQENFPNRAENEKFSSIDEKIKKYDELIKKSQIAIKELEQATEEAKQGAISNEQAVNKAVSELTELITGVIAQFSDGGGEDEKSTE